MHKELSYRLVGICMAIHRDYKSVHNERIYHKALEERLNLDKLKFLSKPKIAIRSRDTGNEIGYYEPDLVIENKIVLELKATRELTNIHKSQLFNYLKVSDFHLGLLINFGTPSLQYKRFIL